MTAAASPGNGHPRPGHQVTCTINNTDNTPQLKLVKVVDNNDGGTAVADRLHPVRHRGRPGRRAQLQQCAGGSGTFHNVFAGQGYILTESTVAGYTGGSWSCDGGSLVGSTVTLALGNQVTCTIHNTDNTPQLKLVKVVDNNDGGAAMADSFTLSAAAGAPDNGRNFSNLGGSGTFQNVFAGKGYILDESTVAGYTAGSWSCDGGSLVGSTVTLALGNQVTCTIHNTDNTPTLKLVKVVDNNDGGTGVANNWTLSAAADAPDNGRNFSNLGGSGIFQNVFAGTSYALSENPNAGTGYSTTGEWSCDGGTLNAAKNAVTLALGNQVTCTITNTDDTPRLKLVKVVDNNDGGAAVADSFTLYATAAVPDDSRNFNNAGGSGIFHNVFAGKGYVLNESQWPATPPAAGAVTAAASSDRRSRSPWATRSRAPSTTPTTPRS